MKLDDLDEVARLHNYRRSAIQMLHTVRHGLFDVKLGPEEISLSTQLNLVLVREFVAHELLTHIDNLETQLRLLKVEVETTS